MPVSNSDRPPEAHARADSLGVVTPGSLSSADSTWLANYNAERARETADRHAARSDLDTQARRRALRTSYEVGGAVLLMGLYLVYAN